MDLQVLASVMLCKWRDVAGVLHAVSSGLGLQIDPRLRAGPQNSLQRGIRKLLEELCTPRLKLVLQVLRWMRFNVIAHPRKILCWIDSYSGFQTVPLDLNDENVFFLGLLAV